MRPPIELLRTAIEVFWASLFVAAVLAKPIHLLLLAMRSRQTIDKFAPETHQSKQGTPTMGGLIIAAGFIPAMAIPVFLYRASVPGDPLPRFQLAAFVAFLGFLVIGFVDDFVVPRMKAKKRGLGWKQKILMEILIGGFASWIFAGGLNQQFAMALFLVLFFSNAYNFSDGLDGLSGSLLLGLASGLFGICLSGHYPVEVFALAALLGGVIPFLFVNAPPAKVFMGDIGSLPIGAVLGLAVASISQPSNVLDSWVPLTLVSIVMICELVPVPMQVGYFKLTKKRLFPFTPIHHAFEKKGWPESRVVWAFALAQAILSAGAISWCLLEPGMPGDAAKPLLQTHLEGRHVR